jgi:hypothetical protein
MEEGSDMSDATIIDLAFYGISRAAWNGDRSGKARADAACEEQPGLRLALLYGEELRLPDSAERLHMLSGTAWVSMGGRDYVLGSGDCLAFTRAKGGAIVSALREQSILFELT